MRNKSTHPSVKSLAPGFAAALALIAAPLAGAAVAVSNLSYETFTDSWDLGPASEGPDKLYFAGTSFTTGAGPGWTLDSITVRLVGDDTFGSIDQDAVFNLYADNGGVPDSVSSPLAAWSITVAVGGPSNYTLSSASTVTLGANTTYWLVGDYVNEGYVYWQWTNNLGQDGLAGWSIGDQALTDRNNTNSWEPLSLGVGLDQRPTLFEINATAVPEPSTFALLGLAGLGLLRRRR